jgi:ubiquinone/menaquinone biosynthesis C-methylase UbiE
MDNQEPTNDILDKIRQQFDSAPYPKIALETSPKNDYQSLYIHNLVTAYYVKKHQVIETQGKVILDAGCGSGYKSLILAEANPGARIVGVDISEESVKLAALRLQHHGFKKAEFHAICIENLHLLDLQFDYINSDDVLYLLPDIVVGLQAFKSVLKPEGIIRANVHSYFQRTSFYRAQELFKVMGLMDGNPGELEIELVREIVKSLKDDVLLKLKTWGNDVEQDEERVLMNYLFQGDKGYTIPEVFAALRAANLEFVSMVDRRSWEILELFKEADKLPEYLEISLQKLSVEEKLHLFELFHPVNRLLDFWCAHPNQAESFVPVSEWTLAQWQEVRVSLHPQLRNDTARENLISCIASRQPFEISRYLPLPRLLPVTVDCSMAACLLPLWDRPQSVISLVERWLLLRALDPVTLEPVSQKTAFDEVTEELRRLEIYLYVLLERSKL